MKFGWGIRVLRPISGPAFPSFTKSGLKLQSGLNSGIFTFWPVFSNRSYGGFFGHIFSDTEYKGLESEITVFEGGKAGLIISFWLADLLADR